MKNRLIAALMVLIIMFGLCFFLIDYGKVSLSQEKDSEIVSAYARIFHKNEEDLSFSCYGAFNGAYVLTRAYSMGVPEGEEVTVDGVTIYLKPLEGIIVYHSSEFCSGEFCSLQEAFDRRLIDHGNLITVKRNYEAQKKKDRKAE